MDVVVDRKPPLPKDDPRRTEEVIRRERRGVFEMCTSPNYRLSETNGNFLQHDTVTKCRDVAACLVDKKKHATSIIQPLFPTLIIRWSKVDTHMSMSNNCRRVMSPAKDIFKEGNCLIEVESALA